MPVTEEQLIQLMKSKGITDEQINQGRAMKMARQAIPQQPQQNKPQSVNDMIRGINPVLGDAVGKMAGTVQQLAGVNNTATTDPYQKALLEEQAKAQFREPEYVVSYDQSGQPVFTKAPGNIKNAPFYSTQQGGQYYQARTGQAESQGEQAKTETDIMNQVKDKLSSEGGQGITPGTTVQAGPYNIPLNPKLSEAEQGVIGGVQSMEPMIGEIQKSLESGVLESSFGDVGRTVNQLLADRQSALFTANNPKLQQLQSQLNTLKKTIPFTEGGKQLTETEKAMVMALLNISGKPNPQIMNDINQAMQILRAKEKLALGGRNAALQGTQQPQQAGQVNAGGFDVSKMSDEELAKMAGG